MEHKKEEKTKNKTKVRIKYPFLIYYAMVSCSEEGIIFV